MKTVGYIRVSTAGQVEEGVSLDAQEDKVRAWADLNNADEVVIFRDEGLSGSRSDNRPGLQDALDVVGKGDALVVYSLSRLSRSTKDTLSISDALQAMEADLVSLSEKIDTTSAAGKMVFRILAVLSEFERDQISDRTKAALAYKQANGQKTGGDVPFGYRVRKGKLYPHKTEQKAVALILDMKAKRESLRAICRALEAKGIARKGGSLSWHPQIVSDIIKREKRGQAA
jgi:DNA invertase Pin-like site-specific DNA recombinase